MQYYNRTHTELERHASKWWPENLVELESQSSIIPILIQTQEQFISILKLADSSNPESVLDDIGASGFAANLFLKHLMVLTDFGSEPLQRVNRDFQAYFPESILKYSINGREVLYRFTALPVKGSLNNKKMRTDADGIRNAEQMSAFYRDLIVLLLFGSNATDDEIANIFMKCAVGNLLGRSELLKEFIMQRYIFVSRITGGAQANGLGNAAQVYAEGYLKKRLGNGYFIKSNGHIPGITQNERTETTFDLTVEKNGKYIGIEISFQVTTNSTIERKAGQAQARFANVSASGNYIAYIIDGAGNFQRESALTTICQYSHCTVAYADAEFDILINFIREKLDD